MSDGMKVVIAFWALVMVLLSMFWWPHWARMAAAYTLEGLILLGTVIGISFAILDAFD